MKINKNQLIYVVDDDRPMNSMICMFLQKQGLTNVHGFLTGEEMLERISIIDRPIIIQDFDLPGLNGLDIIREVKSRFPRAEFIFLSGQSSIEVAIEAIRLGAFDYIVKDNFAKENCYTKINNLLRIKQLIRERSVFKIGAIVFISLLIITWVGFLLFLKLK